MAPMPINVMLNTGLGVWFDPGLPEFLNNIRVTHTEAPDEAATWLELLALFDRSGHRRHKYFNDKEDGGGKRRAKYFASKTCSPTMLKKELEAFKRAVKELITTADPAVQGQLRQL